MNNPYVLNDKLVEFNYSTTYVNKIEVGLSHSCAMFSKLMIWALSKLICWGGYNEFGQITDQWVNNNMVKDFSVGDEFTCIVLM